MATSVLPKAKECPTLIAAAYVGLGASRTKKEGLYTPNFMGFIQLKIHYSKEYTVQGNGYFSSRSVQGCIRADLTNRIFNIIFCMEYSPHVNSMVYTVGKIKVEL